MKHNTIDTIKEELKQIKNNNIVSDLVFKQGQALYMNGQSQLLTQAKQHFEFSIDDEFDDFAVKIDVNGNISTDCNCHTPEWCHHKIACLMELSENLTRYDDDKEPSGKKYTREGMIKRVINERMDKALKAEYRIEFADNIYGEHILTNEKAIQYKLTFRDLKKELGYCSCPDYKTNKLGTCKHLMFAFRQLSSNGKRFRNIKIHNYPFVDIFLDPLQDYQIAWFFPHTFNEEIKSLIEKYFEDSSVLSEEKVKDFLIFIREAEHIKQIFIRPEVLEKVEASYNKQMLRKIEETNDIDFSFFKGDLMPYQKEGIEFATFREGAIIADEMGLGKTIEAIGVAIAKKKLFGFKRTLIICPASIKDQWKREIERFSDEKAIIVDGFPDDRAKIYRTASEYFLIVNYETVLRDSLAINNNSPDFIILDEAQRIKNYTTLTASSIKSLIKRHSLVITGTPIENRLIDLYSIVNFIDPKILSPLWEFSYQHCYFDMKSKNKITGYYNLQHLKKRMKSILIRREKQDVLKQLPNISQIDVPVDFHPKQAEYHASYAKGIAAILKKKFITPFDMQHLMLLLSKMRMVCDSTWLVDHETNFSPKLIELEHILLEKLDIKNNNRKILIFSEWKRMNYIIGKMLRDNDIGFVELSGDVPVKKRPQLIREFEDNINCRVFISTEAGGTGLNLQVADTVINFELPWNPSKKNQRIGRIDRIGQLNKKLTVISFITRGSIEMKIASGLVLKQNLFDGVLSDKSETDMVDFSEKGRSQFLRQLEEIMNEFEEPVQTEEDRTQEDRPVTFLDLVEEPEEDTSIDTTSTTIKSERTIDRDVAKPRLETAKQDEQKFRELEEVMNQGMGFLSGMFKMATGKELLATEQGIEINKKTGEVIMKFKLPV